VKLWLLREFQIWDPRKTDLTLTSLFALETFIPSDRPSSPEKGKRGNNQVGDASRSKRRKKSTPVRKEKKKKLLYSSSWSGARVVGEES